ncbi:unnamed protein product [Soboliphyme baturini]|uniref:Anaphase-promoting complex subunit 1 n=1 Tax=Soboliphyme baturini TaxID=241478 RepID=A0A183ITL1_9BILA|nr:unnamed protein product [Soboliphyme baturini]
MYFSCVYEDYFPPPGSVIRPVTLRLVHLRLPPGFSANSRLPRPSNVHMCHFSEGTTVLVQMSDGTNDLLTIYSSDCFGTQSKMIENVIEIPLCGRTWDLARVPPRNSMNTQALEFRNEYVIITAQGIQKFEKMRCIDFLRQILFNYGPESQQVQSFFKFNKVKNGCAITCDSSRPVLAHDGRVDMPSNFLSLTTKCANESAPGLLKICFSSRHNAFYIYLSRLIGSLLDKCMVYEKDIKDASGMVCKMLESSLTPIELRSLTESINAFLAFFKVDMLMPHLIPDVAQRSAQRRCVTANSSQRLGTTVRFDSPTSSIERPTRQEMLQAFKLERQSLILLSDFLRQCSEVLNLWFLLCAHQFNVVVSSMSPERREFLKKCTLRTLVVDGREI